MEPYRAAAPARSSLCWRSSAMIPTAFLITQLFARYELPGNSRAQASFRRSIIGFRSWDRLATMTRNRKNPLAPKAHKAHGEVCRFSGVDRIRADDGMPQCGQVAALSLIELPHS